MQFNKNELENTFRLRSGRLKQNRKKLQTGILLAKNRTESFNSKPPYQTVTNGRFFIQA